MGIIPYFVSCTWHIFHALHASVCEDGTCSKCVHQLQLRCVDSCLADITLHFYTFSSNRIIYACNTAQLIAAVLHASNLKFQELALFQTAGPCC